MTPEEWLLRGDINGIKEYRCRIIDRYAFPPYLDREINHFQLIPFYTNDGLTIISAQTLKRWLSLNYLKFYVNYSNDLDIQYVTETMQVSFLSVSSVKLNFNDILQRIERLTEYIVTNNLIS